MKVDRFVLYLHDFDPPIGARLAIRRPERMVDIQLLGTHLDEVVALVVGFLPRVHSA